MPTTRSQTTNAAQGSNPNSREPDTLTSGQDLPSSNSSRGYDPNEPLTYFDSLQFEWEIKELDRDLAAATHPLLTRQRQRTQVINRIREHGNDIPAAMFEELKHLEESLLRNTKACAELQSSLNVARTTLQMLGRNQVFESRFEPTRAPVDKKKPKVPMPHFKGKGEHHYQDPVTFLSRFEEASRQNGHLQDEWCEVLSTFLSNDLHYRTWMQERDAVRT